MGAYDNTKPKETIKPINTETNDMKENKICPSIIDDYYKNFDEMERNFDEMMQSSLELVVPFSFIWWEQKDGKKIRVSQMTKQHLQNSINKIKRENWRMQWLETLILELEYRNQ